MAEFKNAPAAESKKATATQKQEGKSETAELEYSDNRSSAAQLVSLQAAADDKGNRSNTTQLQARASLFMGASRLAQLKAASNLHQPTSSTTPVQRQENKTGLPDQLKSGMESLSGLSLSDVKVHRNSDKPAQLQAHAYAQGTDIHLGPGQEKHLPHELGHVVQQKEGRVKPTTQLKGKVNINDNVGLEKEADVMGAKALQLKAMSGLQPTQTSSNSSIFSSNTFQLAPKKSAVEQQWDKKGDRGTEKKPINPAPDKIDRRKEELWPKDANGKEKPYSADVIDKLKLDDDLWFKSSEGIEDVEATKEHLPAYDKPLTSAYHVTTHEKSAGSILSRIDPRMHNPAGRFGGGFYVASDLQTSYAEIQAHEFDNVKKGEPEKGLLSAVDIIEYTGAGKADLVDVSASQNLADMVKKEPKKIEKKVRQDARDGIVFNSTKGKGKNIVLFKNYGVLKAKDKYTSAADGFKKFKEENPLKEESPSKDPNQPKTPDQPKAADQPKSANQSSGNK